MKELTTRAFAAVRQHKGKGFIDVHTMADNPEASKAAAEQGDKESPEWATYHPVIRIAYVEVTDLGWIPAQYKEG